MARKRKLSRCEVLARSLTGKVKGFQRAAKPGKRQAPGEARLRALEIIETVDAALSACRIPKVPGGRRRPRERVGPGEREIPLK